MRFLVIAEDASQFAAWQQAQLAPAPAPADGAAARGLALFQQMTCANCHAIGGTGSTARVGPDLTHFASRIQFGAGVAENTAENLRRWLTNPQSMKPGVLMPDFKLNDGQLSDVVGYFETLK
jgi:cytochrome c oxidase subunit 2